MSEFSAELRPLYLEQREAYQGYLQQVKVLQRRNSPSFNNKGFFEVVYKWEDSSLGGDLMWSSQLLEYPPELFKLRTTRYGTFVLDNGLDLVKGFDCTDVRYVAKHTPGLAISGRVLYQVGRSGYLLRQNNLFRVDDQFVGVETQQLDEILMQASQGIRPADQFLVHRPFIQVDPDLDLAGTLVSGIYFDNNFAFLKIKEIPDAAVLTEDGHLLGRKVRYPLSRQNWDLRAELGLVKQPVVPLTEPAAT